MSHKFDSNKVRSLFGSPSIFKKIFPAVRIGTASARNTLCLCSGSINNYESTRGKKCTVYKVLCSLYLLSGDEDRSIKSPRLGAPSD